MKAESNVRPENKFEIENIIDGKCEIVFYDNIQEIEPLEEGQTRYTYDIYRIKVPYRDDIEKELNDDEDKYNAWLDFAKEQNESQAEQVSIEERLSTAEAVIAEILGGEV